MVVWWGVETEDCVVRQWWCGGGVVVGWGCGSVMGCGSVVVCGNGGLCGEAVVVWWGGSSVVGVW